MFENLFKRKIDKERVFSKGRENEIYNFYKFALSFDVEKIINKIGGKSNFSKLLIDSEIYSMIDKRMASILDTRLKLEGGIMNDFFTDQILPFEKQLKQDFFWSQFNGYGVEQIIYNEDRSGKIEGFIREEFYDFEILPDLIHARYLGSTDNEVLPYGKYVVTTNNGSYNNPHGVSIAEKLILTYIFKCNGLDLWQDFSKRFANGFLHARADGEQEEIDALEKALIKTGKSSLLVTNKDTEFNLLQPNRDSSLYIEIQKYCNATIQKVILGETQTSDMQERGSSASASIHNEVRLEKTRADIDAIEEGINETILQIALVNGFIKDSSERFKLPKAKIIYDPSFNSELASRDATLSSMGVKFSKKYYINNYGFEEDDFEVVESQPSFFSKERSFLNSENVKDYLGTSCNHVHNFEKKDDVDEISELVKKNTTSLIDIDTIFSAIETSKNEKELDEKLLALIGNRNNDFIDTMTQALYLASAEGAKGVKHENK